MSGNPTCDAFRTAGGVLAPKNILPHWYIFVG